MMRCQASILYLLVLFHREYVLTPVVLDAWLKRLLSLTHGIAAHDYSSYTWTGRTWLKVAIAPSQSPQATLQ